MIEEESQEGLDRVSCIFARLMVAMQDQHMAGVDDVEAEYPELEDAVWIARIWLMTCD